MSQRRSWDNVVIVVITIVVGINRIMVDSRTASYCCCGDGEREDLLRFCGWLRP
jgi:hypothetical protein